MNNYNKSKESIELIEFLLKEWKEKPLTKFDEDLLTAIFRLVKNITLILGDAVKNNIFRPNADAVVNSALYLTLETFKEDNEKA